MSDRITAQIERLGHLGDGIAPGPYFAPRMLPGEVVSAVPEGSRLTQLRIETPSADRIAAPCRHYKACGGCSLQHASDAFVASWKEEVVRTALAAQGLDAPFRDIHVVPPNSRRRATLSGRRLKKGALIGFHAAASDTVTDIPGCLILTPKLLAARAVLAEIVQAGASRSGEVALTVIDAENGIDLSVRGGKPLDRELRTDLARLAGANGIVRFTWNGEPIAQEEPPVVRVDGIAVTPPPGAFLQATASSEAAIRADVAEALSGAERVADLFAGCGTFALPLARSAEVIAVEGERESIDALDAAWRNASGLKKITTIARDLFRRPLLPDELAKVDGIVIDPPRAGAEAQMREIAASNVPVVASVSCSPATFARDAAILVEAGFRIDWLRVVDQFRWSPHVEIVAKLSRG
ncbi:class I SAM-dependent RNA methyltransferase [Roseicyclus sp. F158]|uniref:Class I SAM-dependent RNA methyltransferase n=1 Tax=Tropicimonas omnivorans TaxID=3075590 RepID=A0ABU3DEG3_9RHOB|nr:class I SAM-dependent RNA methyltransferase [Roseicyclus sp. F158]MDT0681507.1 class I SAM-dependent RNA methyltransferase [Roseicyclus sp. F158]